MQFYTKCAFLILICAVLSTAHLSGEQTALPRPTGWIVGERDEKESRRGKERKGMRGKGKGAKWRRMGKKEKDEGKEWEEFCEIVIIH